MSETDLTIWTDLPKEIDEDFVSYEGDYDFPHYLSEEKEWVHLQNINPKDRVQIFEPFLITELTRFVPYIANNRVEFHALNMPNVKIRKIEIVGFVLGVYEDARYYRYQVDDGTGNITIYHRKQHSEINTQQQGNKIDIKDKLGSNTNIKSSEVAGPSKCLPDQSSNLKHKWSTKSGTIGGKIKRCNYVHATGYCALDFLLKKKEKREKITHEDLSNARLNFLAHTVTCISEHEYNKKLISWTNTVVKRRYDKK